MNGQGETRCPYCGSVEIERVSAWGGQLITSQVRCRSCNTYFEVVREELGDAGGAWTSS